MRRNETTIVALVIIRTKDMIYGITRFFYCVISSMFFKDYLLRLNTREMIADTIKYPTKIPLKNPIKKDIINQLE